MGADNSPRFLGAPVDRHVLSQNSAITNKDRSVIALETNVLRRSADNGPLENLAVDPEGGPTQNLCMAPDRGPVANNSTALNNSIRTDFNVGSQLRAGIDKRGGMKGSGNA